MNKELTVGTIVKYKTGWMRVKTIFKNHLTLHNVFGGGTLEKGVKFSEVTPGDDGFHQHWRTTESYKSM